MTPEAKVLKELTDYLKRLKDRGEAVWFVKIAGGPRQRAGLPDLHITFRGRSIWIEVKSKTGEATPLQEATLRKIREAGGAARVVRSVTELITVLSE